MTPRSVLPSWWPDFEYFTGDSDNYSAGDCVLSSSDNTDNCPNDKYHVAFYPTRSSVTSMRNAPIKLYRSTARGTSNRYFVEPTLPQTIANEECSSPNTEHDLNVSSAAILPFQWPRDDTHIDLL